MDTTASQTDGHTKDESRNNKGYNHNALICIIFPFGNIKLECYHGGNNRAQHVLIIFLNVTHNKTLTSISVCSVNYTYFNFDKLFIRYDICRYIYVFL